MNLLSLQFSTTIIKQLLVREGPPFFKKSLPGFGELITPYMAVMYITYSDYLKFIVNIAQKDTIVSIRL